MGTAKTGSENAARLKGLFNIAITPFDRDGRFDPAALAENIERLIAAGYDGFLIGGTYGEFPVMTAEERATLFRTAMAAVKDRVPVLLCSAGADMRTVRDLTELASSLGGIPMVTPPFVSEITDDQIALFFKDMAPVSQGGLVIYNAPGIGITLSPSLIARIADIPGIIGLKQGDLAPSVVDTLIGTVGGKIRLFCASDLQMPGPIVAGFDGVSSTNSNALPEVIHAAYHGFADGDARTGGAAQRSWYTFRAFARRAGQPQAVKAAMRMRGWKGGYVRLPLRDITARESADLQQIMSDLAAKGVLPANALSAGTTGPAAMAITA